MNRFTQANRATIIDRLLVATMFVAVLSGCGRQNPPRVPVQGTVTFRGDPVVRGSIALRPTGETSGPAAGGEIVDGKFEIPRSAGPVIGSYAARITIVRPDECAAAKRFTGQGKVLALEVFLDIESGRTRYDFQLPSLVGQR